MMEKFIGKKEPEEHWSCKRSPDISANYKHKTWLQMTLGFLVQAFILISESCSAKVKGTSYTHIPS